MLIFTTNLCLTPILAVYVTYVTTIDDEEIFQEKYPFKKSCTKKIWQATSLSQMITHIFKFQINICLENMHISIKLLLFNKGSPFVCYGIMHHIIYHKSRLFLNMIMIKDLLSAYHAFEGKVVYLKFRLSSAECRPSKCHKHKGLYINDVMRRRGGGTGLQKK